MLSTAFRMVLVWTVLTGLLYPLGITVAAQLFFPHQANGSLIADGQGSTLIGQQFSEDKYFWGRPSAISKTDGNVTTSTPYDASNSMGSNLGSKEPKEAEAQKAAMAHFGVDAKNVPIDLLTASASGLDPHISPAGAEFQVARVAKARHLDEAKVHELVRKFTQGRTLGFLGEARVNVLLLNRALDGL